MTSRNENPTSKWQYRLRAITRTSRRFSQDVSEKFQGSWCNGIFRVC